MAETKKGKVINLTNIGNFPDKQKPNVIWYQFSIVFEDGVSGIVWTQTADGSPWKVGEEKEYTLEHDASKNVNKIKAVGTGGGGYGSRRGNYVPEDVGLKTASIVLGYAKDLAMDKIIPIADVIPKSEEYYAWVMSKQTKKEE